MAAVMVRFDQLVGDTTGTKFRRLDERFVADHDALCRAFSLDPIRAKFDLPDSWRGLGSQRGDGHRALGRICNGVVLFHDGSDYRELGKVTIIREGERFRDVDPLDPREFYNLDALR